MTEAYGGRQRSGVPTRADQPIAKPIGSPQAAGAGRLALSNSKLGMVRQQPSRSTHTLKVQVFTLPARSRATQVTFVQPNWKMLPDGGTQVMTGLVSQLSLAV